MEIRTLDSKRVREAAKVLAEAFTDEPLITQLLPLGTLHRQRKIADYFVWSMRQTGLRTVDVAVDTTRDKIIGVALWKPPGHVSRWLPGLPAKTGVLRGVGRRGLRVLDAHAAAGADKHPSEPYWHLVGVGTVHPAEVNVSPDEAQAVKTRLIAHRLRAIDTSGCLASLEATTPEHVQLYQAFGFSHQCELGGPATGTTIMWRPPQAGGSLQAA